MGFLPASCRSATIRRPAAYEAAALPTELRRRNRLGMRGGGWAMRAKEFLPCGRLMPSAASCSRSGTQRFACDHWSHRAFAGIRTRTEQFLRLSPLPVGLRKHARTPLSQCSGGIRVSPRFALKPAVDALGYGLRHDIPPGVPAGCGIVSSGVRESNPQKGNPTALLPCRLRGLRRIVCPHFAHTLTQQHLAHALAELVQISLEQIRVGVERHRRALVPDLSLHGLDVGS